MNYIIIDLEWNQARSNRDVVTDSEGNKLYGEIIQIGAIKLDEKFNIKEEFKLNVRPKFYKLIHRKVRQITGISQEELARGDEFRAAMEKLRTWCGADYAFLTWGPDDIRILRRNIEIYGDDSAWINTWFNLQTIYNIQTESGDNQKSLISALEHFGITPSEPMHDARNDAYYTALVARRLNVIDGIAELMRLERLRAILDESRPLLCEVYGGYKLKRNIFSDNDASTVRCPECGNICEDARPWVNERNDRYLTLASCAEHGSYIVRMTVSRDGEKYSASKVVFEAGGGALAHYEKCVKRAEAERKKRKRKRKCATSRKKLSEKSKKVEK